MFHGGNKHRKLSHLTQFEDQVSSVHVCEGLLGGLLAGQLISGKLQLLSL